MSVRSSRKVVSRWNHHGLFVPRSPMQSVLRAPSIIRSRGHWTRAADQGRRIAWFAGRGRMRQVSEAKHGAVPARSYPPGGLIVLFEEFANEPLRYFHLLLTEGTRDPF